MVWSFCNPGISEFSKLRNLGDSRNSKTWKLKELSFDGALKAEKFVNSKNCRNGKS